MQLPPSAGSEVSVRDAASIRAAFAGRAWTLTPLRRSG
eukprot:gene40486-15288_t